MKILAHDQQRGFDHTMEPAPEREWQQTASVTNQGLLNILNYCNDHHPLDTIAHWRKARDYRPNQGQTSGPSSAEQADGGEQINALPPLGDVPPNTLSVFDPSAKKPVNVAFADSSTTVYQALKQELKNNPSVPVPENECSESGSLIVCVGEVSSPKTPIKQTSLEKSQLYTIFGPKVKNKFLTCQHKVNELAGMVR